MQQKPPLSWLRFAVVSIAIAYTAPAAAVAPRDFDHAWSIVTDAPNTSYRVELPEQAILSTRHHWADSVVLDASDHPMPFSVSDTNGIAASTQQPRRLKCSPQAAAGSTNLVYRCVTAQAIDNVYGVRVKGRRLPNAHTPLKVDIRDQDGATLAKFDGEAGLMMGFTISGTPIAFDGTHRIEALEFEMFTPGQEVADVEIAAIAEDIDPETEAANHAVPRKPRICLSFLIY